MEKKGRVWSAAIGGLLVERWAAGGGRRRPVERLNRDELSIFNFWQARAGWKFQVKMEGLVV